MTRNEYNEIVTNIATLGLIALQKPVRGGICVSWFPNSHHAELVYKEKKSFFGSHTGTGIVRLYTSSDDTVIESWDDFVLVALEWWEACGKSAWLSPEWQTEFLRMNLLEKREKTIVQYISATRMETCLNI